MIRPQGLILPNLSLNLSKLTKKYKRRIKTYTYKLYIPKLDKFELLIFQTIIIIQ